MKRIIVIFSLFMLAACDGHIQPRPSQKELKKITAVMPVEVDWVKQLSSGLIEANGGVHLDLKKDVFFMSDGKVDLVRFSAKDAEQLGTLNIGGSLNGALRVTQKNIYAVTEHGMAYKLDRETGGQLWSQNLTSESLVAPVVSKGIVIFQTNDGNISAYRDDNGDPLWSYTRSLPSLSLRGTAQPVIADDVLVAGLASGRVVTLSIFDGKLIWESTLSVPKGRSNLERMVDIDGQILIADDVIYVGGFQGRIAALSRESGRLLWSRELSTPYGLVFSESRKTIYLTDDKGHVWALDRATGATVWRQDGLAGRIVTAPQVQNGQLMVGDRQDNLFWIKASDGVISGHLHYYDLLEMGGEWAPTDVIAEGYDGLDDFPQPRGVASIVSRQDVALVAFRNGMVAHLKHTAK
jgi:outer membrane protein assembly factor BamB